VPLSWPARIAVGAVLVFFVLCPVLIRLLERAGHEGAACFLSYVGYLWMGFIFLFFVTALLLELYRLLLFLATLLGWEPLSRLVPSPRFLLFLPLVVSLSVNLYGFFEARHIRIERVVVHTDKLPTGSDGLRLVQVSDVHVGMIVRGERLARICDAVRKAKPDLLVSTGDFVDGQLDSLQDAMAQWRAIDPPYGKYAVTGNHEFYAGLDSALAFTRDAGFRVLRNEADDRAIGGGRVRLVGVDDPTARQMGIFAGPKEEALLAAAAQGPPAFTILLKHQPIVREGSPGGFDLQLSGHTHGGQIAPFGFITRLFFPHHRGYYELPRGSALYVSRGSGFWGPPVRFLSPPEVTVFEIRPSYRQRPG
jgi:predicted MPP superfamily phosphohydrolase